jgi:uncharacterized protein YdcH (DUF465 family)
MKENAQANAHFLKIFDRHNELDKQIENATTLTDTELEVLKKEKLLLKDEAYAMIIDYKKEHSL